MTDQPTLGNGPLADWDGAREHGEVFGAQSLDPSAGGSYRAKPVWSVGTISANLNRTGFDWYTNNYGELGDGVLNYGFWRNYEELANSYYVNAAGDDAFDEVRNADAFSAFTVGQATLARESIALWDDLIAISFRETRSGSADITYANTDTGGAQAYAYLPFGDLLDDTYADFDFDEVGRISGDVWIDGFVPSNFNPLSDGYYAKLTMVHETGHALGLSHPGDYDALDDDDGDGESDPITYENDAFFAQDSLQYSVMSYFDGYETGAQHIDWSLLNFAFATTPLVHDIAAIQAIYGADRTTRTGNTVFGFNATANREEFDFGKNTRPVVSIWDAGGVDTLDFSGWNTPSTIDLNAGAFSSGGGIEAFLTLEQVNANRAALSFAPRSQADWNDYQAIKAAYDITSPLFTDNISIAYGTTIENAVGGGGNDRIVGNGVANVLTGNGGADLFELRTARVSGADRITDFGPSDVLATTKAIRDGNGDGIITWSGNRGVSLDTDGDAVVLTGARGLRYLGGADGLFYYGELSARPVAVGSNQRVIEGTVGADTLTGSALATRTDIFFFDTANAAPGTRADSVLFTAGDLLVTTTAIRDGNGDGIIAFANGVLDLPGNGDTVALRGTTGSLSRLEYDGSASNGGVSYYVYSYVGSSVGVADLHFA